MATTDSLPTNRAPITTGCMAFVAEVATEVTSLSVEEAKRRLDDDRVVFVDVRDRPELEHNGKIPGAVHASRRMLEFHVDPDSPFHLEAFGPDRTYVLYCSVGGRSALAAKRLQEMGLAEVAQLDGGYAAWLDHGGPVEAA